LVVPGDGAVELEGGAFDGGSFDESEVVVSAVGADEEAVGEQDVVGGHESGLFFDEVGLAEESFALFEFHFANFCGAGLAEGLEGAGVFVDDGAAQGLSGFEILFADPEEEGAGEGGVVADGEGEGAFFVFSPAAVTVTASWSAAISPEMVSRAATRQRVVVKRRR